MEKHSDETSQHILPATPAQSRLCRYGRDELVSRSQAKRVIARFEHVNEADLDFSGIESIGQAFADEIFRVYATTYPGIKLVVHNANEQVSQMIRRALAAAKSSKD